MCTVLTVPENTTSKEPGVYIDPGITGMRLIGDDIYFLGVDDESTQWIRYADGTFTPTGIEKKEIGALKYGYIRYENGMQKCSNCGIPRGKYSSWIQSIHRMQVK